MKRTALIISLSLVTLTFGACSLTNSEENLAIKKEVRKVSKKIGTFKNLSAAQFKEQIDLRPGTVLDVREEDEIGSGIIENAVVVGLYSDNFDETIKDLEKNKPVYIYDESGSFSVIAAKTLLSNGFSEVYSLVGGVTSWGMEGFELVSPKLVKGNF